MSRPSNVTTRTLLWAAMAVALLVAGCGGATATASPAPTTAVSPSARISASPFAAASGSQGTPASAAPTTTDQLTIGLPHVDAALEDLLPSAIGGIDLQKFSMPLSTYVASSQGGEKALYPPWLVKLGTTPGDVDIAVAADLTQRENFVVKAIKVPGAAAATLTSSFSDVASKAGWPVSSKMNLPKPVLQITDPTAQEAGLLGVGYVYAKDNVFYVVVTDDLSLLIQGLASLP